MLDDIETSSTERQMTTVESGTVAMLNKSEIDQQIATAHKYPRSLAHFRKEMLQMVTLTEKIAGECIYALPRKKKDETSGKMLSVTIEGPSARFAEVAASAWGNARAGARIVNEGPEFVTAQGVFHDLERNVAITYEVQRRIVDSRRNRYRPDMIGVTANAACSIALRNAILKGIPKAFWSEMYEAARLASVGDVKTIANRRADAIKAFVVYGVTEKQILTLLDREGVQDITVDDLITLNGYLTAIKEGDSTAESIFGEDQPVNEKVDAINKTIKGGKAKPAAPTVEFSEVALAIENAATRDDVDLARDQIRYVLGDVPQQDLRALADAREKELAK